MKRQLQQTVTRAFDLLYGPAVPYYDWISRVGFAGEWARWQRTVLRFLHTGPVLEIGSGTGDLLALLAQQQLQPVGLERSAPMINRTRQKARQRGQAAPPLVRGDVQTLPFADATFNAVVATFPTAWVLRDQPWQEIDRVLHPGGIVAVVLSGELQPDSPGRWLRALAYRPLFGRSTGTLPPPPINLLNLQWATVPTTHGRATLLIGGKA